MRTFQRDGRVVRFQWTEASGDTWREVFALVRELPGRVFVPEGKYHEALWDRRACEVLQGAGFIPGEVRAAQARNLEREAARRIRPDKEREAKATEDAKLEAFREILRQPWTPPWLEVEVDLSLANGLRPYQVDSMRFLKHRKGRGIIGDDMGLGKTLQALSWIEINPELRPAVIVTTAATKYQWVRERRKWYKGGSRVEVLSGKTPSPWAPLSDDVIYVLNWDILDAWRPWLEARNPKIIVGDEIQNISNYTSSRSKAFCSLGKDPARHVIGMSGTPIRTRPLQFYPILNLVDPVRFTGITKFKQKFCALTRGAFGQDATGASNIEELHIMVRDIMIRRTKKQGLPDLPEKIRTPVLLQCVKNAEYEAAEDRVLSMQGVSAKELRQAVEDLSRSAFAVKQSAALDWIQEFLEASDDKLIVFAWHRAVVEFIAAHFGSRCVKVYGGIGKNERERSIAAFREDPRIRLFIGNMQAAGEGIDGLQEVCSDLAFVELHSSPAYICQPEDRIHRSGQLETSSIWYLLAEDTVDTAQLEVLEKRRGQMGTIFDGVLDSSDDDLNLVVEEIKKRRAG